MVTLVVWVCGVSRAPVDRCKEVLMRETSRSTTDRPWDEARLQVWVSANMTGPRGHVAFITRTWSTGNRAGGEADLKWAALVNKLITCPEASASSSETFIQLTYADCCFGLLPKADSRSRENDASFPALTSCRSLLSPHAPWPRSDCIWCLSWTFRWLRRSLWTRSLQRLLLRSEQRLLGSSLPTARPD